MFCVLTTIRPAEILKISSGFFVSKDQRSKNFAVVKLCPPGCQRQTPTRTLVVIFCLYAAKNGPTDGLGCVHSSERTHSRISLHLDNVSGYRDGFQAISVSKFVEARFRSFDKKSSFTVLPERATQNSIAEFLIATRVASQARSRLQRRAWGSILQTGKHLLPDMNLVQVVQKFCSDSLVFTASGNCLLNS